MQLQSIQPMSTTRPDPAAVAASRALLVDARDAVRDAVVATTNAGGIDSLAAYWTHRATVGIGRADGLVQAVEGMRRITKVPIARVLYLNAFDEARRAIADAAALVQSGGSRVQAAELIRRANERLARLDGQFLFEIDKHDRIVAGGA